MKKLLSLAIVLIINLLAMSASASVFLHGTGPNDNPPTLFLDNTSPTATTAKYRDSVGIKFSGGNLWKEIGSWRLTTTGTLAKLSGLHVWLGLKNSDDIGTNFDVKAEVYKNDVLLITTGEIDCIKGITRNPDLAKEVALSFGSFSPVDFSGTDTLSLKIFTRIGTNGAGASCGGHSNAVGLRLYFDAVSRPSRFDATINTSLEISITSPLDGETINRAKIMVRGTVRSDTNDIGITVNGILAEITGNNWIANSVPLTIGSNTITAVVTDSNGNTASKAITVTTNSNTQFVTLSANVTSGIPPLQVNFSVSTSTFTPASYQMDFDGDGVVDYTGTTFENVSYTYISGGIFYPRVIVTDNQGNVYSDTIGITVLSKSELDALLGSKWDGMRAKLAGGDIEGALVSFDEFTKQDYRDLFNVLSSLLPTIVQEMADIQFIEYLEDTAIYDIQTTRDGITYSFQLLFTKDSNGIWRINSF